MHEITGFRAHIAAQDFIPHLTSDVYQTRAHLLNTLVVFLDVDSSFPLVPSSTAITCSDSYASVGYYFPLFPATSEAAASL